MRRAACAARRRAYGAPVVGRVVRVALTARGEMMAADLVQAAKLHESEVLARHPEAEAVAIKDLLRAIVNRQARPRRG